MSWFIGQSAVMIVLAFLLGILVGWIIWGRRVRVLIRQIKALQEAATTGDGRAAAQEPPEPVAPSTEPLLPTLHIPAPRVEVTDTAELEVLSGIATEDTLTEDDLAGKSSLDDDDVLVGAALADTADTRDTVGPDELIRIEGIGPKISKALNNAGIVTYEQLAMADTDTLWAALRASKITFAPSLATWARQARLLADGDESGFLALTDALIAGREVPATAAGQADVEPEPEPEPEPDNLVRIEGIGPKISAALIAAGIRTYRQLAEADEATLTTAVEAGGITFAPSLVTWSEQAKLLADGDEEAFAKLTDELIAGRRVAAEDDLERIEGIGPQMAAALHAAGIRSYKALAGSSETRLRNAIAGSGLSFAPSIVTWAQQAKLLADGDEDGFADLTRRLVAGRDEGRV